jgi:hypothetical protein
MSAAVSLDPGIADAPPARPAPRRLPYVPGFGGHRRRWVCKCTIADELICGVPHPDKRESPDAIRRRKEGALVTSEREARRSAWLADLYGTGAERSHDLAPPTYKRESEAKLEKVGPPRRKRALSDAEWRTALAWMRRQPLKRTLEKMRQSIAAQTWLELCTPPVRSVFASFADEVRRAWERAVRATRDETEPMWALPKHDPSRKSDQ